jgi:hypothetical protein
VFLSHFFEMDQKHSAKLLPGQGRLANDTKLPGATMVELTQSTVVPPHVGAVGGTATVSKKSPAAEDVSKTSCSVQKALSRIFSVLVVYGLERDAEYGKTIQHWIGLVSAVAGPDAWVKVTKYKLTAFYAFWLNQPLPKRPFEGVNDNPALLFGGRVGRWLRAYLLRRNDSITGFDDDALGLLFSLKQSKKALPRPSREFVRKAEFEAHKKLTEQRWAKKLCRLKDVEWGQPGNIEMPMPGRPWTRIYCDRSQLTVELRRTVKELFAGSRYTFTDRVKPFFPSTSANYINSRAGGGAVGYLLRPNGSLLSGLRSPGFQGFEVDRKEFEEAQIGCERHEVGDEELCQRFGQYYYRLLAAAEEEAANAVPLGLAEALKARVITKCPPLLMTVMKPIQKAMWRTLQKHPCFRLVGQPIDAWYLQDRLGGVLGPDEVYLSGDYSDATNELESWVSEAIAEAIAVEWRLPDVERRLLLRSLTGFVIEDPNGENALPQRNGQLMGSVTSFPVLCIANAALCRFAAEVGERRRFSLTTLPGCFNGDDVVLKVSRRTVPIWRRVTAFAGLSESVGKTYVSDRYLEMNSRLFRRRQIALPVYRQVEAAAGEILTDQWLSQIPFVNAGLMYGMKRSGRLSENDVAGSEDSYRPSAGSCANDLVDTAPDWLRDRCMREFVKLNRLWLDKVRVPWYMPRWLGGVGLPAWEDDEGRFHGPTALDLAKAKQILLSWSQRRPSLGSDAEWRLHQLACERLPKPRMLPSDEIPDDIREASDRLYGHAVISLLFDSNISTRDMWVEGLGNKRSLKSLSKNTSLWSKAKPLGGVDLEKIFGNRGDVMVECWPVEFRNRNQDWFSNAEGAFALEILTEIDSFRESGRLARIRDADSSS